MEDNKDFKTPPRRGRMGGPRGMGMAPEKAKDFKGSISKLMSYIGRYKIGIFAVMLFAAVATVFNVIGPKILGKVTTALSEGLMRKIAGTGGMDFNYNCALPLSCKCHFQFLSGLDYDGNHTESML